MIEVIIAVDLGHGVNPDRGAIGNIAEEKIFTTKV